MQNVEMTFILFRVYPRYRRISAIVQCAKTLEGQNAIPFLRPAARRWDGDRRGGRHRPRHDGQDGCWPKPRPHHGLRATRPGRTAASAAYPCPCHSTPITHATCARDARPMPSRWWPATSRSRCRCPGADDPVEPQFGGIAGPADQTTIPITQLVQRGRRAADELMQARVAEHGDQLVGVVHRQRGDDQPVGLEGGVAQRGAASAKRRSIARRPRSIGVGS